MFIILCMALAASAVEVPAPQNEKNCNEIATENNAELELCNNQTEEAIFHIEVRDVMAQAEDMPIPARLDMINIFRRNSEEKLERYPKILLMLYKYVIGVKDEIEKSSEQWYRASALAESILSVARWRLKMELIRDIEGVSNVSRDLEDLFTAVKNDGSFQHLLLVEVMKEIYPRIRMGRIKQTLLKIPELLLKERDWELKEEMSEKEYESKDQIFSVDLLCRGLNLLELCSKIQGPKTLSCVCESIGEIQEIYLRYKLFDFTQNKMHQYVTDARVYLKLYEAIRANLTELPVTLRHKVNVLESEVLAKAMSPARRELVKALLRDPFDNNTIQVVITKLEEWKLSKELRKLMKDVVDEVYETTGTRQIIEYLRDTEMEIIGYRALLDKMKEQDDLTSPDTLELAQSVQQATEHKPQGDDVQYIKDHLPLSVRNLVFSNKVCIRNEISQYLFASRELGDGSMEVRLQTDKETLQNGTWRFERQNDTYTILNIETGLYLDSPHDNEVEVFLSNRTGESQEFSVAPKVKGDVSIEQFSPTTYWRYLIAIPCNMGTEFKSVMRELQELSLSHWTIEDCSA